MTYNDSMSTFQLQYQGGSRNVFYQLSELIHLYFHMLMIKEKVSIYTNSIDFSSELGTSIQLTTESLHLDVLPQYNGAQTEPLPLTSLKPFSYISYYSQPSVSAGSSTMESTNYRQKIPKRSKKQGLILLCSGNYLHYIYNYLHSIYTVLGIVSNLE